MSLRCTYVGGGALSGPWRAWELQVPHPLLLEQLLHLPAGRGRRLGLLHDLQRGAAAKHREVCQVSHAFLQCSAQHCCSSCHFLHLKMYLSSLNNLQVPAVPVSSNLILPSMTAKYEMLHLQGQRCAWLQGDT